MKPIATSIEQSEMLMDLGIPVETADMRHIQVAPNFDEKYKWALMVGGRRGCSEDVPAWSLEVLLDFLPPVIVVKNKYVYTLNICHPLTKPEACRVIYHCQAIFNILVEADKSDFISSAVDVIVWLCNNGFRELIFDRIGSND